MTIECLSVVSKVVQTGLKPDHLLPICIVSDEKLIVNFYI